MQKMIQSLLVTLPHHSKITMVLLLLTLVGGLSAQDLTQFENEIAAFEEADKRDGYAQDFILFTGSSSIRLWHSMQQDMKGLVDPVLKSYLTKPFFADEIRIWS